ncbi:MAG: hypothetical protein K6E59_05880 [Bacilli bacterium]|nr:hypothetical protein [Bacilli bacterium]
MKLHYQGSIRRLQGSGMAFASFDNDVDPAVVGVGKMDRIAVPDSAVTIDRVGEEDMDFTFHYFDSKTPYHITRGEQIQVKKEGNAFGFHLTFTLED